jgi:hypothetical protein
MTAKKQRKGENDMTAKKQRKGENDMTAKKQTTKKEQAVKEKTAQATEKKSVVKKEEAGKLQKSQEMNGRGFENFGTDDLIIPYAKLMQPLSPEVEDEIAKPGDIINSLNKENFGTELTFIPLIFQKKRIKWIGREAGGGIDCQSLNSRYPSIGKLYASLCRECQFSKWSKEGEAPECTEFLDFPAMTEEGQLIVVSFCKTSYKAGKQLVNTARFSGGDLFSKKYTLTTKKEKNDKGTYFVFSFKPAGLVDKDTFEIAERMYQFLHSTEWTTHTELNESPRERKGSDADEDSENLPSADDLPF